MNRITPDLFTKFLDGEANAVETMRVLEAIKTDPFWRQRYVAVKRYEAMLAAEEPVLPLERMAAQSEDKLCDILCERFILRKLFPEYYSGTPLSEAKDEQSFLKGRFEGVALYNVGRIMERYGLAITRQFHASLTDLQKYTASGEGVIAVIDQQALAGKGTGNPDHAVCVLEVGESDVVLYNPVSYDEDERLSHVEQYPVAFFLKAWSASENYLVAANRPKDKVYTPHPLDLSDIEIDDELTTLLDSIAEDLHDLWAVDKIAAGFTYAPLDEHGNEQPGHNHYLLPFSMLSEADKEPDRKNATQTLRLVHRLGYEIRRVNAQTQYTCPDCGKPIELVYSYCPHCGRKLGVEDY